MLKVILHGLLVESDEPALSLLIHDNTRVGHQAAKLQVDRLRGGDTVILTMNAERIPFFLREAGRLGVRTADMLVGRTDE